MTHLCVNKFGSDWLRKWFAVCSTPNHYLDQCWFIVNRSFEEYIPVKFELKYYNFQIHIKNNLKMLTAKWWPFFVQESASISAWYVIQEPILHNSHCFSGCKISNCKWYYLETAIIMAVSGNKHSWTRQIWGIWKLRPAYSPETPNLGQNGWWFVPCDLEIWWMTLENNRASLLSCFKLCAIFHSHRWIQTGVTVRKRPIWVKFDNFFLAVWPSNLTDDLEKQ